MGPVTGPKIANLYTIWKHILDLQCRQHVSLVCLFAVCWRLRSACNDKKCDEITYMFVFHMHGIEDKALRKVGN